MSRLEAKIAPGNARLAELGDFLRSIALAGPEPVLPTVVASLPELIGSEQSLSYLVDETGDEPRLEFFHALGIPAPGGRLFARLIAGAGTSYQAGNVFQPDKWNVAVTLGRDVRRDWWAERPVVRDVFPHWGVASSDQARVLVAEGGTLLAWVGGFRAEPFTQRECDVLEAIAPTLARRLALERQLSDARMQARALDAALEAIASAAFLVDDRGSIRHANAIGRSLADFDVEGLQLRLRAALLRGGGDGGGGFSVSRIVAPGMRPHFLLVQRAAVGDPEPRLATAATRWSLTRRQRDVLALVVQGHANKTIAERLGLSASTVELHVSSILEKASAESRAELASKFWTEA